MDCVEVCPVDCFYEGENMLVIHPEECIDCGVCEPECPVDAIKPDTEPELEIWLSLNAEYAKIRPNIKVKKHPRLTIRSGRGSRTNSNTSDQIQEVVQQLAPLSRSSGLADPRAQGVSREATRRVCAVTRETLEDWGRFSSDFHVPS